MKLKIIRSTLMEGIKSVQNIVAGKGSMPILQNVLLEAIGNQLTMTTTDLDISIQAVVECKVEEAGKTTLPVKFLSNWVMRAPEGEIEIEVDVREQANFKAANAKYRLTGKPAVEFPKLNLDEESREYKLSRKTFHEMLRKTYYAASQDDTRRTLKGLLMSFKEQKLTMVATDGRRLAFIENEVEFPKDFEGDIVLPSKTVQELVRSINGEGDVKIEVQQSKICFKVENVSIISKLIEENYPNYRQVIPNECKEEITIDRQLLLDALDRASVMTMDEAHSTKLIFEANKLIVTSAASDIGEANDVLPIKYAGERVEIMFNPTYVMDPLKAIDQDEIVFKMNNGYSPAVITCEIPFFYVLMPLRINN